MLFDVVRGGTVRLRTSIIQQKTGRPVPFELTDPTREALTAWLRKRPDNKGEWLFPSRSRPGDHVTTRQYGRLLDGWVALIGLDPAQERATSVLTWADCAGLQTEELAPVKRPHRFQHFPTDTDPALFEDDKRRRSDPRGRHASANPSGALEG